LGKRVWFQAWGLALQRHAEGFEGIKYTSRFLDQPCLALVDREGLPGRLKAEFLGNLDALDKAVNWLDEREAALI
jgi:hypothetical protein